MQEVGASSDSCSQLEKVAKTEYKADTGSMGEGRAKMIHRGVKGLIRLPPAPCGGMRPALTPRPLIPDYTLRDTVIKSWRTERKRRPSVANRLRRKGTAASDPGLPRGTGEDPRLDPADCTDAAGGGGGRRRGAWHRDCRWMQRMQANMHCTANTPLHSPPPHGRTGSVAGPPPEPSEGQVLAMRRAAEMEAQ